MYANDYETKEKLTAIETLKMQMKFRNLTLIYTVSVF